MRICHVTAVGLALLSAAALRRDERRAPGGIAAGAGCEARDARDGRPGARRCAVAAAAEAPARGVHLGSAWPFVLAGLLSPGAAQILVTYAIRDAGASRVSMVFGLAPLVSVTIALVVLREPCGRVSSRVRCSSLRAGSRSRGSRGAPSTCDGSGSSTHSLVRRSSRSATTSCGTSRWGGRRCRPRSRRLRH